MRQFGNVAMWQFDNVASAMMHNNYRLGVLFGVRANPGMSWFGAAAMTGYTFRYYHKINSCSL